MRVPLPDDDMQELCRELKRHIKAKYRYQKVAAEHYGMSINSLKRILRGTQYVTEQMLADAGIRIRWSLT